MELNEVIDLPTTPYLELDDDLEEALQDDLEDV